MAGTLREHLVAYLTYVYSIERQALAQLETAPNIAGEPRLADAFRRHLEETERQAEMIEQRLEDLGGSPKRVKDAVMALGGRASCSSPALNPTPRASSPRTPTPTKPSSGPPTRC